MRKSTERDYEINTDDKFGSRQLIDLTAEIAAHEPRFKQMLTTRERRRRAAGHYRGRLHWHKHDAEEEFFLVLEGWLLIDLEDLAT